MPDKPLISKVRINSPNKKGSAIRNRNYLMYIATRDGVDITPAEYADVTYYDSLFGNALTDVNNYSLEETANNIAEMTRNGRNVFNGVISLYKTDATNLGYDDRSKWIEYANLVMPDIAKNLGISIENMRWVASVHMDKKHPHLHYMIWDESDKVRTSFIRTSVQDKIRLQLAKEMFNEEYNDIILCKNTERDTLLDMAKAVMKEEKESYLPGTTKIIIPDRISRREIESVAKELKELIEMLPDSGRINYKLVPENCKQKTDEIRELLFKRGDFKNELSKYLETIDRMSDLYVSRENKNTSERKKAKENAVNDINKRIGNIILKTAKELRAELSVNEYNKEMQQKMIASAAYSLVTAALNNISKSQNRAEADIAYSKRNITKSKQVAKDKAREQEV